MRLVIKRSAFNETFYPLLDEEEHDTILLLGGAASGKSYFAFQRAVIRALQDRRKYLVLRKSGVDLRRSCWEDLTHTLKQFRIYDSCKINNTFMTVELPNGSSFLCMGMDDDEKVKSIPGLTDAILEECSEMNLDDFSQVRMRLRGEGRLRNQVVLMTNPISKVNWVYKHFFEHGCKEESCLIHRSTYRDNRFVNEGTVRALESYKETNPMFYRIYCLGEFGSLSKQVLTNYRTEDLDFDSLRKMGLPHLVGLDFGFVNDETAIVESLLDEESKRIYVLREFYRTGLLNNEIAAQLLLMGLQKSVIIADSSEQKSIEEIKRAGIPHIKAAEKGKGSIMQGIQKLQQYELVLDSSCCCLLEELENYSYKKDRKSGEYLNEPVDEYNHAIDALRYSLQCANVRTRLKSLPKYSL